MRIQLAVGLAFLSRTAGPLVAQDADWRAYNGTLEGTPEPATSRVTV